MENNRDYINGFYEGRQSVQSDYKGISAESAHEMLKTLKELYSLTFSPVAKRVIDKVEYESKALTNS